MKKHRLFSALIVCASVVCCSYTARIRTDLDVTASIANSVELKVGLYIPREIDDLTISGKTDLSTQYAFKTGESVRSILENGFRRVFKDVLILDAYPTENMLTKSGADLAAVVDISEANAVLSQHENFYSGIVQITADISFFDSKLARLTTILATGTGMGKEEGELISTGKREFSSSVEKAVSHLGNSVVQQVYGNYDIRKKAEKR